MSNLIFVPGVDRKEINPLFLSYVELLAASLGKPSLMITSGYRSPEHEKSKGRSGTGAHTERKAVDISCTTSSFRKDLILKWLQICKDNNLPVRIGVAKTFVHVDISTAIPPAIWTY